MWTVAGYSSVMGSAEVVPPPPAQVLRVYHVTSAEYGVSNISLSRLKVSRFSDLNDPFELMAVRFKARSRAFITEHKQDIDSHTGLLCFSSNWTNPVLWSHYGDKHRGVCLGFDLARDLAEEVQYEDTRVRVEVPENVQPEDLDEGLQALIRRTKFSDWKYEAEQRVMVPLADATKAGSLYFHPFGPNLRLAEVILGPRCSLPLHDIRSLVDKLYPGATTISARLAFGHFAVVPKESTVP